MRVLVDANVLVYLFDAEEPAKQERACEIIAELGRARSLVLSSQVLSEFYVTVTRKLAYPLEPATALGAIADLAVYPVVAIDAALVRRAAARAAAEPIAYWDALILEAAVEAGASSVYSEDLQPGRAYTGVAVQNPLAMGPAQATSQGREGERRSVAHPSPDRGQHATASVKRLHGQRLTFAVVAHCDCLGVHSSSSHGITI